MNSQFVQQRICNWLKYCFEEASFEGREGGRIKDRYTFYTFEYRGNQRQLYMCIRGIIHPTPISSPSSLPSLSLTDTCPAVSGTSTQHGVIMPVLCGQVCTTRVCSGCRAPRWKSTTSRTSLSQVKDRFLNRVSVDVITQQLVRAGKRVYLLSAFVLHLLLEKMLDLRSSFSIVFFVCFFTEQ